MVEPVKEPVARLSSGAYPAMVTAFHENGAIDWEGVDRLTDFSVQSGVAGIFACGLSAEIKWMDDDEKGTLAERIARRAAGRISVVAAAISDGPPAKQADLIRRMHAAGADAVAIAVCQLADETEDDSVWIRRAETLLGHVPEEVRLALYECPLPCWRLLTDETLRWVAHSGRFHFLKDTCCDIEKIRPRLEIIRGSRLQLFNANTETLLASLQAGADGFCGIGANYLPDLYTWLCEHFQDEPDRARDLHHFLNETFELTEGPFYPVSAKAYLRMQGVDIGPFSRKLPPTLPPETTRKLNEMRIAAREWTERLVG